MAKRRRSRRRGRRAFGGFGPVGKRVIGGLGYGFVRDPINNLLKGAVPGIFGQLGDEVLLLGGAILARNMVSGIPKQIVDAAIVIESHNLGRNLGGGIFGGGGAAASGSAAPTPTV